MVMPSPIEEYLGQVWDPKNTKDEIASANSVIDEFLEDMSQGRMPKYDLDQIAVATDTIGLRCMQATHQKLLILKVI